MKKEGVESIIRDSTRRPIDRLLTAEEIAALGTAANVALAVIASAGVLALAAVAPNVFKAVGSLLKSKKPYSRYTHKEKQKKTARAFYYLKESGMVHIVGTGKRSRIVLTKAGRSKYERLIERQKRNIPGSWQGTWWLVAADIPTKDHRAGADAFRSKLKRLNFFPLQRTLWVYPYNPSDMVQELAEKYGIQHFITVMEVVRFDNEDQSTVKSFYRNLEMV